MTLEQKTTALEIKLADEAGMIEGYGSVFGSRDGHGDTVMAGAFATSLTMRSPKMLWQHDMDQPIGRWTEAREDGKGLFLRGQIATASSRGRDAYELIKAGALDGLSIGYRTRDYEHDGDGRILKAVDLYEVSLVTIGANAEALLTSVKAQDMTERDFERHLRAMGFDRTAAKKITVTGFKGYLSDLRDAGVRGPELDQRDADEIKRTLQSILQR